MKCTLSLLACLPLGLASLAAQESTTPFREGQWAAQFGWEGQLGSLGVVAFTGATRAWVLDIRFRWRNLDIDTSDPFGSSSGDDDQLSATLLVGRRFYQRRSAKVVTYQSLGLLGSFTGFKRTFTGGDQEIRESQAGAFAEVGAAYMITPNLSLGFTGTAQAAYVTTRTEFPPDVVSEGSGFEVSAPSLVLVATIYF